MKKFSTMMAVLMLVAVLTMPVYALKNDDVNSAFTFRGTTACCEAEVSAHGKDYIDLYVELCLDGEMLDYWHYEMMDGSGYAYAYGEFECVSGKTYTMQAYYTTNTYSYTFDPITKTCP